jgi:hypothetical protein
MTAPGVRPRQAARRFVTLGVVFKVQDVDDELCFVYYGETNAGRLLAVIVTERGGTLRVVTAYDLDAGQKREYLRRRAQGE